MRRQYSKCVGVSDVHAHHHHLVKGLITQTSYDFSEDYLKLNHMSIVCS